MIIKPYDVKKGLYYLIKTFVLIAYLVGCLIFLEKVSTPLIILLGFIMWIVWDIFAYDIGILKGDENEAVKMGRSEESG